MVVEVGEQLKGIEEKRNDEKEDQQRSSEIVIENEKESTDEQDEQIIVESSVGNEIETPEVGMSFQSELEVRKYYNAYGQRQGFGIIKVNSKNGDDGKQKYFSFACARNGKTVSVRKNSMHPRPSIKTNCKARINVAVKDDTNFVITRVYLDHNHDLLRPEKTRHLRCNKVLELYIKKKLEVNDLAGIPLNKNFYSFVVEAGGYENLLFGEKECRNYIAKARELRLGIGDVEVLCNYFQRMQSQNSSFYYIIDPGDDGRILNVFWADARCRAVYESFGDVVSFDTTYLTNSYDMPFAPFVGVNHHGQSILFDCGLLSSETTETFVWLFRAWLACMMGRSPNGIITDQCKAMQNVVAEVFPNSQYRLCLWHIMKKIPAKLGALADYKKLKKVLKQFVYDSNRIDEFENGWMNMIQEYHLEKNEWLQSIYEIRHRWIPVYVKDNFWAGMSTTQTSESMNAFFDDYVHSKTTLKQFVEQYDNALKSKIEKEKNADFASSNSTMPIITALSIEKQFQKVYTNEIFKKFQEELRGLMFCNASLIASEGATYTYEVKENVLVKDGEFWKEATYEVCFKNKECEVQCLCRLFESKGILCRHAISVLIIQKVTEVPSHYVLERW